MNPKNFKPLPACLEHSCGYGFPAGNDTTVPLTPAMQENIRRDELKKAERMPLAEKFAAGSVTFENLTLPFRLFVPEAAKNGEKLPMVVFLHGGGERGEDNISQLLASDGAVVWVRDQLEENGPACFVLAMQCPAGGPGWLKPHLLALAEAISEITEQYPVDENRLYLTGKSMGGAGCWRMNCMYPDLFAAVVPMCTALGLDEAGKAIDQEAIEAIADSFAGKPLWLFHAADDSVVSPETTRSLVKALKARGQVCGRDFFHTEYPAECGYDHRCWNPGYAWELMRDWLFTNTKEPAPLPPPLPPELMAEMAEKTKREQTERAARRVWIDRFKEGHCVTPDVTLHYRLFMPEQTNGKIPLVVMLHGIEGCGNDNMTQITDNDGVIDWVRAQERGLIPSCYVLAPQCPLPIPNNMWEIPYLEIVAREIDRLIETLPIDPARVYLSGLSLGGYGAWNLNCLRPDLFAAIVPCCPACVKGTMFDSHMDPAGIERCAPALVFKPLWMFHSEDDMAVPVEVSRRMLKTLHALGKVEDDSFHVTIYPAALRHNHACWVPAYKDKTMLQWLFAQRLKH